MKSEGVLRARNEDIAMHLLFRVWRPRYRLIYVPPGWTLDLKTGLRGYGYTVTDDELLPSALIRGLFRPKEFENQMKGLFTQSPRDEMAFLFNKEHVYTPHFLRVFRRLKPMKMLLMPRTKLWWGIWNKNYNEETSLELVI